LETLVGNPGFQLVSNFSPSGLRPLLDVHMKTAIQRLGHTLRKSHHRRCSTGGLVVLMLIQWQMVGLDADDDVNGWSWWG